MSSPKPKKNKRKTVAFRILLFLALMVGGMYWYVSYPIYSVKARAKQHSESAAVRTNLILLHEEFSQNVEESGILLDGDDGSLPTSIRELHAEVIHITPDGIRVVYHSGFINTGMLLRKRSGVWSLEYYSD